MTRPDGSDAGGPLFIGVAGLAEAGSEGVWPLLESRRDVARQSLRFPRFEAGPDPDRRCPGSGPASVRERANSSRRDHGANEGGARPLGARRADVLSPARRHHLHRPAAAVDFVDADVRVDLLARGREEQGVWPLLESRRHASRQPWHLPRFEAGPDPIAIDVGGLARGCQVTSSPTSSASSSRRGRPCRRRCSGRPARPRPQSASAG